MQSFGAMLRRRRWLILAISVPLTLLLVLTGLPQPRPYSLEIAFIVGQPPLESTLNAEEERYYNWVASEYIVFGIADWANGSDFAQRVQQLLALDGHDLGLGQIEEAVTAGATRSRLIFRVDHADPEMVRVLMGAVAEAITTQEIAPVPQLSNARAWLVPIDNLNQIAVLPLDQPDATIGEQLALPLRIVLGLLSGLIVAAFVEFFDPTIRGRGVMQALNLPLLGEIPEG